MLIAIVLLAGAFGGYLRYLQVFRPADPPIARMRPPLLLSRSIFLHAIFGAAGAAVVHLIIPGSFSIESQQEVIKLSAVSLLGGYAGRSLLDRVLPELLSQMREVAQKETTAVVHELDSDNAKALALSMRQLDSGEFSDPIHWEALRNSIASSSAETRVTIFYRARERRKIAEFENDLIGIERSIPVFMALIESDLDRRFHRPWGQVGYAYYHLKNYEEAVAALSEAISIREQQHQEGFWLYEYYRASARLKLGAGPEQRQSISRDLEYVATRPVIWEEMKKKEPVASWLSSGGEGSGLQRSDKIRA